MRSPDRFSSQDIILFNLKYLPRLKRIQVAAKVLLQINNDKPTAINKTAPGMGEINEIAPIKISMYEKIISKSRIAISCLCVVIIKRN